MQSCRFTISRRKRPAEPLQHGAHGTGWGAAATAAHVPQLRWQFRGRVLNNAECPKSSCHTRNYCLTREGVEESKKTSMTTTWNENEKSSKEEKSTRTPAISLSYTHTHHTHTHPSIHTHTFIQSYSTRSCSSWKQNLNLNSYSWFSCSTWEVAIFEYFFIIFIRIFLLL